MSCIVESDIQAILRKEHLRCGLCDAWRFIAIWEAADDLKIPYSMKIHTKNDHFSKLQYNAFHANSFPFERFLRYLDSHLLMTIQRSDVPH